VPPAGQRRRVLQPQHCQGGLRSARFGTLFSRAPIPFARDDFRCSTEALPAGLPAYRHIGLYAYRASFLAKYPTLTQTALERFEALEQLRALAHGYRIIVEVLPGRCRPASIPNTDLAEVRRLFEQAGEFWDNAGDFPLNLPMRTCHRAATVLRFANPDRIHNSEFPTSCD
jgi:3-deoxy-manno-octulosonate cytidylyltransferase (CMP-KDO synthetase)